jgi:hypothetical protein
MMELKRPKVNAFSHFRALHALIFLTHGNEKREKRVYHENYPSEQGVKCCCREVVG